MLGLKSAVFLICLLGGTGSARASDTANLNPGPLSTQEANILLQEGSDDLSHKKFDRSASTFKRFIDRYPNDERVIQAYGGLLEALHALDKDSEVLKYGKELLNLKSDRLTANRTRTWIAEANLNLKKYLEARVTADELLKASPNEKQTATAYTIKFQSLMEEKQFEDARLQLNSLQSFLETSPLEPFKGLLPEFKMSLEMRECTISHLLKNKQFSAAESDDESHFTEEELTEYFTKKNLCFKSALPASLKISNQAILKEWCEDFTHLSHELEKMHSIDSFLKQKLLKELKTTLEFGKSLNPELTKCYGPYKEVKTKKRHRKRSVHKSRTS